MDESDFSQGLRDAYEFFGGVGLSIDEFADTMEPADLGMRSRGEFYAPITLKVRMSGQSSEAMGCIAMAIPVHENPSWFSKLQERVAATMGSSKSSASNMDVCNIEGTSISTMSPDQLRTVGQLNVYVRGRRKRLKTVPTPPAEYSANKVSSINDWLHDASEEVPNMVAGILANKDASALNQALVPGGSVQRAIEQHLENFTKENYPGGWAEFVRVSNHNSPDAVDEDQVRYTMDLVSKVLLHYVRQYIGAAGTNVGKYIAARQARVLAKRLQNARFQSQKGALGGGGADNSDLFAPILGGGSQANSKVTGYAHVTADDGYKMYHSLAENAMDSPTLLHDVVDVLHENDLGAKAPVVVGTNIACRGDRYYGGGARNRDDYYDSGDEEEEEGGDDDDDYYYGGDGSSFRRYADDDFYDAPRHGRGKGRRQGGYGDYFGRGPGYGGYDSGAPIASGGLGAKKIIATRDQVLVLEPKAWVETIPGEHVHKCPPYAHKHHHPYWTQVHGQYQPLHNKMPVYYNKHHTKKDLTPKAPTRASPYDTYVATALFLGMHAPPPLLKLGPKTSQTKGKDEGVQMVQGRAVIKAKTKGRAPKLVPMTKKTRAPPVRAKADLLAGAEARTAAKVFRKKAPKVVPMRYKGEPVAADAAKEAPSKTFGMTSVADIFGPPKGRKGGK